MSTSVPWIFLRGLMRDSRHWGEFPHQFREALPEADIVMIDLPGNGVLNAQRSPISIEANAEHCREELARRGLRPPYRVLAMSLGAMVAVAWASRYPQELQACVLINTSLRPFSPFYHRLRLANYPRVLKIAFSSGVRASEEATLRITSCQVKRTDHLLDDWIAWHRARPVSRANAVRQLLAAARFVAPLNKPATRLLLLTSLSDGLVNPCCSQRLAQQWHCDIAEHPSAGHDLPLDDGPWVAEQVRRWV